MSELIGTVDDQALFLNLVTTRKRTLRFEAVRFLRPRLFPLFELALPVKTTLRFDHPHGADELMYKESTEETLLISAFEDEWYGERLINTLPLIGPL